MFKILIVEDDLDLCDLFCEVLNQNGYNTIPSHNGNEALDILDNQYIDLIITDIMMPKIDGYELTQTLRKNQYNLPILMITAKGLIEDKQKGFKIGTDDYMVKPIDVNEMVWRVEALLRRSQSISSHQIFIGNTKLDSNELSVSYNGNTNYLPQKEFLILFKLLSYIDKIFTRQQIIDEIWGLDFEKDSHTLDVHISRLRTKFKDNDDFKIITVRGLGYKAVKNNEF